MQHVMLGSNSKILPACLKAFCRPVHTEHVGLEVAAPGGVKEALHTSAAGGEG